MEILNKERIGEQTKEIEFLIRSEQGFDAAKDIDLSTLRFGAPSEVDYGRGSRAISIKRKGGDAVVTLSGRGCGVGAEEFVCKMIARNRRGELIFGYAKLID